ncbi:MAG: hypothetical protein A3F72_08880 [Bacteroidetes bacterium RIFCSPLOWO2_12_FULL_35_15]|nr:MAG: hypothetical protein A3F72_08880 [Bacteroidetes bacterium RIFCSPLOWO2_12_FULL_35_15]
MNYEAAISYAHQRMREIGKQPHEYHFEPVRVYPTDNENKAGAFSIKAYNEIYVLVYPERYFGLFILSDNSVFNSDNPLDSGAPEFTGQIHFYRVNGNWSFSYINTDAFGSNEKNIPVEFLRIVIY